MKLYDLKDKDGRIFAFEIPNWRLSRNGVCKVVRSIPEAHVLRTPRFLSRFREEEFCGFEVYGQKFKAREPFGDNSRYWIGPEPPHWCEQVEVARDAFARHKPRHIC
jgi:hypothetical protein